MQLVQQYIALDLGLSPKIQSGPSDSVCSSPSDLRCIPASASLPVKMVQS